MVVMAWAESSDKSKHHDDKTPPPAAKATTRGPNQTPAKTPSASAKGTSSWSAGSRASASGATWGSPKTVLGAPTSAPEPGTKASTSAWWSGSAGKAPQGGTSAWWAQPAKTSQPTVTSQRDTHNSAPSWTPVPKAPDAPRYVPQTTYKAPAATTPTWGQTAPKAPAATNHDQRDAWGTTRPAPSNNSDRTPQADQKERNAGQSNWGQTPPRNPSGNDNRDHNGAKGGNNGTSWTDDTRHPDSWYSDSRNGGSRNGTNGANRYGSNNNDHNGWNGDDRGRNDDHRGPGMGYGPRWTQVRPERRDEWYQPYHGRHENCWRYVPLVTTIIRAFLPSDPRVLGAVIVASDDTFLGVITRDYDDPDAVTNGYGRFGSPMSPYSIWNPESRWGNQYAPDSPWNPYATRPPRVFMDNEFRGYLTTNPNLYPRIDPDWLRSYLELPRW
jgi:hypothetical protein